MDALKRRPSLPRPPLPNPQRSAPARAVLVIACLLLATGLSVPAPTAGAAAAQAPRARVEAHRDPALEAARTWRRAHGAEILRSFADLLTVPNVASDRDNIRRNAEMLRDAFARRGLEAELLEVPETPPVVFATLPAQASAEDAPTLLLYAHYDGQPVEPEKWTHDPWTPTLYTRSMEEGGEPRPFPGPGEEVDPEWRLYARAAGDDKAPIGALLAALDALETAGVPRTVNAKIFLEGEEEAGSPHLGRVLETYRDRLDGDLWLFLDGPVHQSGKPQIFFGVRGIATLEITVYGARRYLHSGHYGNWAPNPNLLLAHLLASMKDPDGRVLVDGFYDTVVPPGEAERRAMAAAPPFEDQLRRELGLAQSEGGNDVRYMERLMLPSLNVRGLSGATVGETARNVIPPEATAALDVRLVEGNDPADMLDKIEAHITSRGYHVVRREPDLETRWAHPRLAKVVRGVGYPAVRTPMDLPLARRIVDAAAEAAGEEPVLLPTLGGSLPLYLFRKVLGTPLVGVPVANHDDNQHAPDENLRIGNLWYGIDLLASLLTLEPAAGTSTRPGTDGP